MNDSNKLSINGGTSYVASYLRSLKLINKIEPTTGPSVYPIEIPLAIWDQYCHDKLIYNKYYIKRLHDNKQLLLLDGTREGPVFSSLAIKGVHELLSKLNVDPNKIILANGNSNFKQQYDDWADLNNIPKFNILYFNSLLTIVATNAKRLPYTDYKLIRNNIKTLRPKYFLSYNSSPRPHRIALLLHLLQSNNLDKGLLSFLSPIDQQYNMAKVLTYCESDKQINKLYKLTPLTVDIAKSIRKRMVKFGDIKPYAETYFSIVTDTDFTTSIRRITEKVFKSIAGLHPFIYLGMPHSLEFLRTLGFETFHPFIDESYDNEINPRKRIKMIFSEIDRLCQLPLLDLHKLYMKLWQRTRNNYKHLVGRFANDTTREEKFVNDMITIWNRTYK